METTRDYISVEQSIIGSLIEVKMMQAGLLSEPTLTSLSAATWSACGLKA